MNGNSYKKRLGELEKRLSPKLSPVVIIEPGDPVPLGAEVVIVDDVLYFYMNNKSRL